MADIFLSYASEDADLPQSLANALRTRGWSVFWSRVIVPRATWDEVIERELKDCQGVIALWSLRSVPSQWVRSEAEFAADHNKLIPVIVDQSSTSWKPSCRAWGHVQCRLPQPQNLLAEYPRGGDHHRY